MADYKRMYTTMVDAAEQAIELMNIGDYCGARRLLINAEQEAEDIFVETDE